MKRKIFSKLLMVALVIAAVGSFVSCKDYDDDINNLQKQIDAKAALSELTALQSTLDSKIAAAQSAATAAQAKADAAATKTSVDEVKKALESAIADAKKAGTDAGTQAGTAIAAANKAQETAEGAAQAAKDADAAAKAALADALKTIEETYQTKAAAAEAAAEAAEALAAVKATAEAAYTKAEAEKLQEQVNNLKADLESTIEEKVKEAIKNVDKATASVAAIWEAVTGIDLYVSPGVVYTNIINLKHGKIGENAIFGNQADKIAKDSVHYIKGDSVKFDNDLLVRVTPTTATLTAENLKLINSQLGDLSEIVTIGTPYRYTELITRGAESGIWVVPVERIKNVADSKIEEVTKGTNGVGSVAYALALNNTDQADRYATTAFEIFVDYGVYAPEVTYTFDVAGKDVNQIKNRWTGDIAAAPVANVVRAEDGSNINTNPELVWQKASDDVVIPAYAIINNATDTNKENNVALGTTGVTNPEARWDQDFLIVEEGKDFVVNNFTTDGVTPAEVQYFYVALDYKNAIESSPSELVSWYGYDITGINEVKKATEKVTINIPAGKGAKGDIIGFRVFAVNYDGTLADPDGRAFYVQVGKATYNENTSSIPTISWYASTAGAVWNASSRTTITAAVNAGGFTNIAIADKDGNTVGANTFIGSLKASDFPNAIDASYLFATYGVTEIPYRIALVKSDNTAADTWASIAKATISFRYPDAIVDGAVLPITFPGYDKDRYNRLTNVLNIKAQKVVSNTYNVSAAPFSWKASLGPVGGTGSLSEGGTFTVYPTSANVTGAAWTGWGALVPAGALVSLDMDELSNNLGAGVYTWSVKAANGNPTTDATVVGNVYTMDATKLASYQAALTHVYANVKLDKVGGTHSSETVTIWSGNITVANAQAGVSYNLPKYSYIESRTTSGGTTRCVVKTSDKYYYNYDAIGTDVKLYPYYRNDNNPANVLNAVLAEGTYDATLLTAAAANAVDLSALNNAFDVTSTNTAWAPAAFNFAAYPNISTGRFLVSFTSDSNSQAEFVNAGYTEGTNTLTFAEKTVGVGPVAEVPSTITLKGWSSWNATTDADAKRTTIFSIPVVLTPTLKFAGGTVR